MERRSPDLLRTRQAQFANGKLASDSREIQFHLVRREEAVQMASRYQSPLKLPVVFLKNKPILIEEAERVGKLDGAP